jgi:hypothetical protein
VVVFGGDMSEWVDFSDGGFNPKLTSQFRLRLVRARARVPAFNNIGAYPVDSAQVTLGRGGLSIPYFAGEGWGQPEPRVDILLRFFVPIRVHRFQVEKFSWGAQEIRFGASLDPLDVEVRPGDDRRSIVVTAITDRVDPRGAERIRRLKPSDQKTPIRSQRPVHALGIGRLASRRCTRLCLKYLPGSRSFRRAHRGAPLD